MIYIVFGVLAVLGFGLGRWGQTHVRDLVPRTLEVRERIIRERVMRRGAISCQIAAGLLVVGIILEAAGALGR